MPAIVNIDYEDDGVDVYQCSECKETVAARTPCHLFFHCPWCGVLFTHNEDAHTEEARDKRWARHEARFKRTYPSKSYWFKAYVPNVMPHRGNHVFHREPPFIDSFYFEERWRDSDPIKLKTGDDACFAWGKDWGSHSEGQPQPWRLIEEPEKNAAGWARPLRRTHLIDLIRRYHGCPMWFGTVTHEVPD